MDAPLVETYHDRTAAQRHFAQPIVFWDETLRDGEQMPGVVFSPEEKLRIAEELSDIGIPLINAGIPVVSEKEAASVHRLAHAGLKAKILAAARTLPKDVDAVIQSGATHIAIFVAASEVHLRYKLQMTQDQVFDASIACVRQAKDAGLHVAFVTEDTVRAPWPFIERLYRGVQEAGADRLVVSDTVGIMTPLTFRWFLEEFSRRVRPKDWSVHCHNDFGLATANTLTALEVGVTSPHVCVNGLGERAGNASLEEVAVSLESLYGVKTGLRIERLYQLSRTVEEISGVPLPLNKALVGYNAFSHEAGIHTHGILRHTMTYEPLQPETLGRSRQMILGKHTGKAALVEKLKERQITLSDARLTELLNRVKRATEAHQKTDQRQLLEEYRAAFEHPGLHDDEFWSLVEGLPQEVPGGVTSSNGHGLTLAEKILCRASGLESVVPGQIVEGQVDLAMMHEQGAQTVGPFHEMGAPRVWDPERVVIAIDHWVPASTEGAAVLHRILRKFAAEQHLSHFYDVGNHGICHQILAEDGWVVPGDLAVGTDSHTNMLGAVGAVAAGIGPTEMAAVLALGKLWLKVPPTLNIRVEGRLGPGVVAKDIILRILGEVKTTGATYKAVEFSGPTIERLSMPERFTLCNMTTEMGAKCGMVAPDATTDEYLRNIAKHPAHPLTADRDASYERQITIDVEGMPPMIACPYSPDNVRPLPDVAREHVKVDQAFLGSCTNARIEDLREGAALLKGHTVHPGVRFIVSPASTKIYKQALAEGLLEVFTDAGAVFTNSSCSACFGGNMGILAPDEVCASSSNRNFPGRMGPKEARIYLMSPAATVAAAIRGEITDPREFL